MSVTLQKKPPFVSDFGGFAIVERNNRLYCTEKNVQIAIVLLKSAMKYINKSPIGTKFLVGNVIVGPQKEAHMWRDEHRTYIGCLDEPTIEFNKKYQKLVKHLNDK